MKRQDEIFSYKSAEDATGFLLYKLFMHWQKTIKERLKEVELTHTQFVILATSGWLGLHKEVVTQIEIARHAQMDVMMVSNVLRALERKGILSRHSHPQDTRAKQILLTPKGQKILKRSVKIVEDFDHAFFDRLEDVGGFNRSMRQLLEFE